MSTSGTATEEDQEAYYLGIDLGTQGLTVLLTDAQLHVVATGEAAYDFCHNQDGCYEQCTDDWEAALQQAAAQVGAQMRQRRRRRGSATRNDDTTKTPTIRAIGIAGQMHGEVLVRDDGTAINPVRLWCDGRNAAQAALLTDKLQTKCPVRLTAARFLWTAQEQPERAAATTFLTTPAGWLAYRLTGQRVLGVGDAAGMFPVCRRDDDDDASSNTHVYDPTLLQLYNEIWHATTSLPNTHKRLQDLLPTIRTAGQEAGSVTATGAALLTGLVWWCDESTASTTNDDDHWLVGLPLAAAEGDQVAALAGSLIAQPGTVACSFGTSVCANVVADDTTPFTGVSPAIDHFCAANGQPIHMVWLRNGTTFFNTTVATFANENETMADTFARLMPQVLSAPPDCGGLLALPFMDDEPGLGVTAGPSTALVLGWTNNNNAAATTPANIVKAALLATVFNLKTGVQILQEQGVVQLREIVLSGGLVKTPGLGQIVADVFDCPVCLLTAADEGSSWGAAVLAAFRYACLHDKKQQWTTFVEELGAQRGLDRRTVYVPTAEAVQDYQKVYAKYEKLRALEPALRDLQRPPPATTFSLG